MKYINLSIIFLLVNIGTSQDCFSLKWGSSRGKINKYVSDNQIILETSTHVIFKETVTDPDYMNWKSLYKVFSADNKNFFSAYFINKEGGLYKNIMVTKNKKPGFLTYDELFTLLKVWYKTPVVENDLDAMWVNDRTRIILFQEGDLIIADLHPKDEVYNTQETAELYAYLTLLLQDKF